MMSSVTLTPAAVSRPAVNPWYVATAVVVPTFMEILDTTIATASLRYIAGGLSATMNDSDWVMTSYLAANATILPITGWISAHLGRRNYFLLSIAVFTIASVLCGVATSLEQLILFRVIQGLAGGGLQPASQGVLIDSFPPEKQGTAMTLFGVAGLIAPVIGPTLGGYITVNYNWRWVFLINLPIGAVGFLASYLLVEDPDYLKKERAELRRQPLNFDYIGLGLLALMMACWEVLLSKGQEWDWYNDPFGKVQTLAVLFVVCLGSGLPGAEDRPPGGQLPAAGRAQPRGLQHHHLLCLRCPLRRQHQPAVPAPVLVRLRRLRLRPGDVALRRLLHPGDARRRRPRRPGHGHSLADRRGPARHGGRVLLDGADEPVHQPGAGGLAAGGVDRRPVVALQPDQRGGLPLHPRAPARAAVGLFALLRNEGGSVGMSVAKIIEQRREQFHLARVGEHLGPLNPHVQSFFNEGQPFFMQRTGDPARSQQMTLQSLADLRQQQAASLAYFDVFWLFAVLSLGLVLLVLLMKRSVAEPGERIGGE